MENQSQPYHLVAEIHAHDGPVRSIGLGPCSEIITGCQSNSPCVQRWSYTPTSIESFGGDALNHDHWVTAVTSLMPGILAVYPDGLIITGCMDSKIRLFDPSGCRMMTLEGHAKGIISFSWTFTNKLVSGSWDGTARIWDLEQGGFCIHVLGNHENGVHVLGLPNGQIATTSTGESVNDKPANFRLRLWDELTGQQIGATIEDHSGPMRSACALPDVGGFATTSNDGTVRIRGLDGHSLGSVMHPLQEDNYPPFVLDCASLSSVSGSSLVSVAEDGSVCVWEGLSLLQAVPHPCCVWCVVSLPLSNGDFVTGGHDGVIRLFSKNPDVVNTAQVQQLHAQFQQEVAEAVAKRRKGPSSEEIEKQAKWEMRGSHAGKSEGQVMVFNKSGTMIAAQWSSDSKAWIEVGEVTGSGGDSGEINGVYYDHVVPVEMDTPQGLATLQLGHNNGDNPFVSAQRFLNEHDMGQQYLTQIADWILTKVGRTGPTFDMNQPQTSSGSSSSSTSSSSTSVGTVAHNKSASSSSSSSTVPAVPNRAYDVADDFPNGFASKILPKIKEFNMTAISSNHMTLSEADLAVVEAVIDVLVRTAYYHSSTIVSAQISILAKMLSWDSAQVFPMFDIFRLIAVHPSGSVTLANSPHLTRIFSKIDAVFNESNAPTTALITSTRFFVNCFRHEGLRMSILGNFQLKAVQTLRVIGEQHLNAITTSKPFRAAVTMLAGNVVVAFMNTGGRMCVSMDLLATAVTLLNHIAAQEAANIDAVYKLLVYYDMLAANSDSIGVMKRCDVSSALAMLANNWSGQSLPHDITGCLQQLNLVLL